MADQSKSTSGSQAVSITQVIHIDEAAIRSFLDQIGRTVQIAVAAELAEIMSKVKATKDTAAPPGSASPVGGAAQVSLRQQAEEGGLIDTVTLARLIGIDRRSFRRLVVAGKAPAGRYFSKTMIRWRADEIRDWIDAGCPRRDAWERIRDSRYDDWASRERPT